jgi:hypothetical protein
VNLVPRIYRIGHAKRMEFLPGRIARAVDALPSGVLRQVAKDHFGHSDQ